MLVSKQLNAVGVAVLYTDVYLTNADTATSFFDSLPQKGHLIRRLRIEEVCFQRTLTPEEHKHHEHVANPERYFGIAKYCPNLRGLVIGRSCIQETIWRYGCVIGRPPWIMDLSDHWTTNFVSQYSKLEVFLPPNRMYSHKTSVNCIHH
jgi:hypothetical protein